MKIDGKKIEILQAERGLTATELSKLSGIHRTAICSIKKGNRNARPVTVGKLAKALNVRVEELLIQE